LAGQAPPPASLRLRLHLEPEERLLAEVRLEARPEVVEGPERGPSGNSGGAQSP
jgi:hypothetical protein